MKLVVLVVLSTIAVVAWRGRAELAEAIRRRTVAARLRWVVALITQRSPRPAEVQFGIVREIVALRTVGVSGAVQIPGRVDVWISPSDWAAVGGVLTWTTDEVVAALRRICDLRGWNLGSPNSVSIYCDDAVPRLLPRAQITGARLPEAASEQPPEFRSADAVAKTRRMDSAPAMTVRIPQSNSNSSSMSDVAPVLSLLSPDPDLPPIHALTGTEALVLGRSRTSDVRVDVPTVSGTHCVLFTRRGLWFVDDLSSANGTFVNDERVTTAVHLTAGDTVTFGNRVTYTVR
jgi:hypothetical protein